MKMVVLQLTNTTIKFTPVTRLSAKCIYGMPVTFALPDTLQQNEAFGKIPELASFTKDCMCRAGFMHRQSNLMPPKILFCLESDSLTTKEYQHLPTNSANVKAFVQLEADVVLQDSVEDYVIENYEYNKLDEHTGKLKGILYAVHAQLIRDITKEFKRCSMNVVKIMPPINGLVNATKSIFHLGPNNQNFQNKTFAVIDIGYEKIRMALFNNNVPIFEKTLESIYYDILQIISKECMLSFEETEKLIYKKGIMDTFPKSPTSEDSKRQIRLLLETTYNEIIRNMRVVLSSERLDLENIIFCGAFSSQPNFNSFITELALDTPFENVESFANQAAHPIALTQQATQLGCHPADFFSINGLIITKEEDSINFLRPIVKTSRDHATKISVMVIMTVLALLIMSIPVFLLHSAQVQSAADQLALANPSYAEPQQQLEQQKKLESQIAAIEKDKEALPYQKSKTNEILTQVLNKLQPRVLNISSCAIDNAAGTVTLSFTTSSLDNYIAFRKDIINTGYFTVQSAFTVTIDESTKVCTCSGLVLGIKDFSKYPPTSSSKGGNSK